MINALRDVQNLQGTYGWSELTIVRRLPRRRPLRIFRGNYDHEAHLSVAHRAGQPHCCRRADGWRFRRRRRRRRHRPRRSPAPAHFPESFVVPGTNTSLACLGGFIQLDTYYDMSAFSATQPRRARPTIFIRPASSSPAPASALPTPIPTTASGGGRRSTPGSRSRRGRRPPMARSRPSSRSTSPATKAFRASMASPRRHPPRLRRISTRPASRGSSRLTARWVHGCSA